MCVYKELIWLWNWLQIMQFQMRILRENYIKI